jgi:hypothetical protein
MVWLFVACKSVDPAPTDIDGLSHYFWQHYDDEEPESLADGIKNAFLAIDPSSLDEPMRGSITDLSREELDLIGKTDEPVGEASGIFFANIINCPINSVERGIYALNQDERHPGDYSAYNREYTMDLESYEEREEDWLGWHTTYSVDKLGVKMTVDIDGTIRYTSTIDEETTPYGDFFLSRGILREDAPLEGNDDGDLGMFQDYQLEVYFQLSDNETVHFFTIWRDVRYTSSLDFSSEFLQGFVLDGMIDWDQDAEAECQ